jgi:hypothetical protein
VSGARHHGPSGDHTAARAPDAVPLHYARHRPEQTTLYRLVQQHTASFIAHTEAATGSQLPRFIKDELDAFLECGILAHGFLRLRCGECGHDRLLALLTRRGVLLEDDGQSYLAESDTDAEEARTLRPLQAGAVTYRIAFGPRAGRKVLTLRGAMPHEAAARQRLCADIDGFSLHAAVRVEAHDRKRLERLCRYITRPALSQEHIQVNAAGQVALRLKTPWRDGTTHLVLSPLEFLQRLAALVPRPRRHTPDSSYVATFADDRSVIVIL